MTAARLLFNLLLTEDVHMADFPYNESILANLKRAFSNSRLDRYLAVSNGNLQQALELHLWNTALGEALHMPLQHFELLLRNSLNEQLTITFGTNWYDTIKPDLEERLQKTIDAAKSELSKMHRPISPSGLVAQLTFGFWLTLLKKKYDTVLWRTALYRAFPNGPKPLLRSRVHDDISKIRELRNRIAHHEPIFQRALDQEYAFIISVASWICPDTASWIGYHSRFKQVWASRQTFT